MKKKEKELKGLKGSLEKEHGRSIAGAELEKVENFLRTMAGQVHGMRTIPHLIINHLYLLSAVCPPGISG
jgi:hypothetical protein